VFVNNYICFYKYLLKYIMNIYYILGLNENCNTDDIIKKYDKFNRKYNPINNKNSSNYEILKFKEFTKEYKKLITQRLSDTSDNNDINTYNFNKINNEPIHNSQLDITKTVDITLNDLYNNKNISINYQKYINQNLENDTYNFDLLNNYRYNDDLNKITINNKGNINNNEYGNLVINFNIQEHKMFKMYKNTNNIVYKKNISVADSICGFVFYIQHIDNHIIKVDMNNKVILGRDKYWVIKNEGLPLLNNYGKKIFGDIYIDFIIDYPDTISITNYQKRVLIDLFSGICSLNPANIKFDKSVKPNKLIE